jgi:hypothetical protein
VRAQELVRKRQTAEEVIELLAAQYSAEADELDADEESEMMQDTEDA